MLHGVSHEHDLAWRDELTTLEAGGGFPLRYVGTVSRPHENPTWAGSTGRVEAIVESQMDEHELTSDNTTLYLCGNPAMVSAVDEIAAARGFRRSRSARSSTGRRAASTDGERETHYLTTAIFYPSPKPGAALDVRGHRRGHAGAIPTAYRPEPAS